jgi:TonB family protein
MRNPRTWIDYQFKLHQTETNCPLRSHGMNVKLSQKKSDGTARRWPIACLLSILGGCPIAASADCPSPLNPSDVHFSDAAGEFYADMCRESDVPLVFASDPSVKSRLQLPSGGRRLTEDDIYPDQARRLSFEGTVVVALVVELDGTVQHSKIVQSSGHQVLDYAEWMYWKQYKFDSPGKLDGAPTRVLLLERMNFKLTGRRGLPASFSDWVVANLGRRILQPYTRTDANALYQDLDETAKSTTSPSDIQKRFARYAKQFGAMSYVEYKGLAGVKNVGAVPHYELMYLVRAAVPRAGAAALIVTAVDRQPQPGITEFDFKESSIRLNF